MNKNIKRFPIYKVGHVYNPFKGKLNKNYKVNLEKICISYPVRLDAMAINPSAVCYNDDMIFTPGEVVVSIDKFITVTVKVIDEDKGELRVSNESKRKSLIKHSYYLMCDALKVTPSLSIDVKSDIPKHCGFGSSSSTITAVAAAINELYGNPIENNDLIKYLASNHGEEIDDNDEENLKMVQCIGGGATGGLTDAGIIIIAGKSTTIAKMKYKSEIIICTPKDFTQKTALELMKLEENNLWKFKETGDKYSKDIAYNLLHKALPDMVNGSIKELADVVFDYRFNMGSIENCSFVYENMINQSKELRKLYENGDCQFISLSSVGPAFFILESNKEKIEKCVRKMQKLNMEIIYANVWNEMYKIEEKINKGHKIFWKNENTAKEFLNMPLSKYVVDTIDNIIFSQNIKNAVDIGCGAGRYSKYLLDKGINVTAIDKYKEMYQLKEPRIRFIQACMDDIPLDSQNIDLVLSIGVIHNSVYLKELKKSIKEIFRILKDNGQAIISVFTNDLITDDLIKIDENKYSVNNREDMILLSKNKLINIFYKTGFKELYEIDEHITDVGGGKRNVFTVLLKK